MEESNFVHDSPELVNLDSPSPSSSQDDDVQPPPDPASSIDFAIAPDFQPEQIAGTTTVFGDSCTRGCKWSPDGLCILTNSEDNRLRIFDLPSPDTPPEEDGGTRELQPAVVMKEGEMIYDYEWYPLMDSSQPETCCLVSTAQYQPIHLYDAFDGSIRATYRCINHLDEMVAAKSVCFSPCGSKIIAGLKNELRIFDINVPGKQCEIRPTKNKKTFGAGGIVSCIAVNPAMPKIYAIGTYSKMVGVYMDPRPDLLCLLTGQRGGVTHIRFTPDGTRLLTGGRMDSEILVWDLRNPGELLYVLNREVATNQRIYFDIDASGRYCVSGGTDGGVRIWDLEAPAIDCDVPEKVLPHCWLSNGMHDDCVNGVSFHPRVPLLATAAGQRHFDNEIVEEEEEGIFKAGRVKDFSLKIWSFVK